MNAVQGVFDIAQVQVKSEATDVVDVGEKSGLGG